MFPNIPLFLGLQKEELDYLSQHAVTKVYPRNTIVINEGDQSDSLYIISSGRVKVFLSDEEGKEVVLNVLGPNEYFGELALLDEAPRSASVITTEKTTKLSIISKQDFSSFLSHHPDVALRIIEALIKRLRSLSDDVKSLALMDVYGRVARTLLKLAQREDDHLVITEKLTQQDIADRVGASREMVGRIMKDLQVGQYIQKKGGLIIIKEKLPEKW